MRGVYLQVVFEEWMPRHGDNTNRGITPLFPLKRESAPMALPL